MSAYHPDLAEEACHLFRDRGHQMVVEDLQAHPNRSAEYYALAAASLVHATLTPNARKRLLATMADNPTMAGWSEGSLADFVEHKRYVEELRRSQGFDRSLWNCGMRDIAIGIAEGADELFRADGYPRIYPGGSVRDFVFQFVRRRPEHRQHFIRTPVARPADAPSQVGEQALVSVPNELSIEAMKTVAGATELSCPAFFRPLNNRSQS